MVAFEKETDLCAVTNSFLTASCAQLKTVLLLQDNAHIKTNIENDNNIIMLDCNKSAEINHKLPLEIYFPEGNSLYLQLFCTPYDKQQIPRFFLFCFYRTQIMDEKDNQQTCICWPLLWILYVLSRGSGIK